METLKLKTNPRFFTIVNIKPAVCSYSAPTFPFELRHTVGLKGHTEAILVML